MDQLFLFSVATKSLSTFIEAIAKQGGMSYSNNFDVEFHFTSTNNTLLDRLKLAGLDLKTGTNSAEDSGGITTAQILKMFCEEAQIPNIQAATGQYTGRRLGEGQVNYAHTKLYTDFQLGWMCDANMTPLKFLNSWMEFIFPELDTSGQEIKAGKGTGGTGETYYKVGSTLSGLKSETGNLHSRDKQIRLRFPDDYQCNIIITKTERGASAPNSRGSIMYTMIDCFPYAIDAIPLSYGASQVTKVTANFYYSKLFTTYNDITGLDRGRK